MDWRSLIPTPDSIPAPWWVFEALGVVTFTIHLLFMNVALGGTLMLLASRLRGGDWLAEAGFHGAAVKKIPSMIALAVNFGVAPLLFVQVLYGHLMYSSSVLMGVYWLLVIPLLILAYYCAYIYARRHAVAALAASAVVLLYIAFMQVNNMTLMLQPEKWTAYFEDRGGTLLNLGDATLIPRYLHFVTAAVAVAGLFSSVIWAWREKQGAEGAGDHVRSGLRVFAHASAVEILIGFWWLVALPRDVMMAFMGGNLLYTVVLMVGIGLGVAAMVTAFMGKLAPTAGLLLGTLVVMVINRAFLRAAYVGRFFSVDGLEVVPQYGVLALFLIVFAVGLAAVRYILNAAYAASRRGAA